MEITKRTLFLSLFVSFVCLIASIVCACVMTFNTWSLILLGAVTVTTIITTVLSWRVSVIQNRK